MKIYYLIFILFFKIFSSEQNKIVYEVMHNEIICNLTILNIKYFKKIELTVDNNLIGYLQFQQECDHQTFLIADFYIYPDFRKYGYGKFLLTFACNYLKDLKIKKVKLIPCPYELIDGSRKYLDIDDSESYTKLYNFYDNCGFQIKESVYMVKFLND